MNYYICRLNFKAPVHFGGHSQKAGLESWNLTCGADTIFAALYMEALGIWGEEAASELLGLAAKGEFLISDLMPFKGTSLYLPRPVFHVKREPGQKLSQNSDTGEKKKLKAITHLPVSQLEQFLRYLHGLEGMPIFDTDFGSPYIFQKVAISGQDKPQPYAVGSFVFNGNSGLYFICALADDEKSLMIEDLVLSLGASGIGGKTSLGFGRFEAPMGLEPLEDFQDGEEAFLRAKLIEEGPYYLALAPVLPGVDELADLELERCYYMLIQRRGFTSPMGKNSPVKKRPVAMFAAGSCFSKRLAGRIADLSPGQSHPAYRYGKGLFMAINPERVVKHA